MIHIVFNEPDIKVLQEAQQLDESLAGDIIQIKDDYAVGPLYKLSEPEGWKARRDWWQMLLDSGSDYDTEGLMDMVDDRKTLFDLKKKLNEVEEEIIWIWAAQNKHDVSGYYWLISQMAEFQGRIFLLYLNNLPFINEKGGIFYPQWLSQILPKEFIKAKKLARPVTTSEFELDTDEWQKICEAQQFVRLLEGGKKLNQFGVDFYDKAIEQYVSGDFLKGSRIVQQFLSKEKETTGDVFVLWRLKEMVTERAFEVKGDLSKTSKDFELRNPSKPSMKKKDIEAEDSGEA